MPLLGLAAASILKVSCLQMKSERTIPNRTRMAIPKSTLYYITIMLAFSALSLVVGDSSDSVRVAQLAEEGASFGEGSYGTTAYFLSIFPKFITDALVLLIGLVFAHMSAKKMQSSRSCFCYFYSDNPSGHTGAFQFPKRPSTSAICYCCRSDYTKAMASGYKGMSNTAYLYCICNGI